MAVQFPNFLSVPVRTPDYSSLADIVQNYYAGKAMPKDDLIKAIQAEFARPNAEQSLLSSKLSNYGKRLSNRKEQLDIDRIVREAAEQKAFEKQLREALAGGNGGQPGAMPATNAPAMNPSLGQALGGQPVSLPQGATTDLVADGIDPTKMAPRYRKFDMAATGLPLSAYKTGVAVNNQNNYETLLNPEEEVKFQKWKKKYAPNDSGADYDLRGAFKANLTPDPKTGHWPDTFKKPNHPTFSNQSIYAPQAPQMAGSWQGENYIKPQMAEQPEPPHEIVVAAGSPHLLGVDAMWEKNPVARALLEKKGFKKTQEVKFDNKTGKTSVITKYPSGTITIQSIGQQESDNGIPLTNAMITKHQQVSSAVDNLLPTLEELRDLPSHKNTYLFGNLTATGTQKDYQRLVNAAKENIIRAFALNPTDSGLKTALDQLTIGGFETEEHYKKAMNKLIAEMKRRKEYSDKELKRSNKIQPISRMNDTSSIDDTDPAGLMGGDQA